MLRPIGDTIMFVFLDKFEGGNFVDTTESGIIYKSFDTGLNTARWAKVVAVGDRVKEITPGMKILIEPLRWTEGFTYDGVKIWKTVEKEVIAIGEDSQ